ncbi:DUF6207 family protein [Streptomyces longwoodensis]|uniref:DUF6207 family protein n=2 Tax=Streptomyces longwoodensis TaxID=68231 RepID=UPI002E80636B|nr:DUF6207 family protein [Streptomyces longwoodensis]
MKPIRDVYVDEQGLLVMDLAAPDDDTAFAMQNAIARRRATALAEHTTHQPGERVCDCAVPWTCAKNSQGLAALRGNDRTAGSHGAHAPGGLRSRSGHAPGRDQGRMVPGGGTRLGPAVGAPESPPTLRNGAARLG